MNEEEGVEVIRIQFGNIQVVRLAIFKTRDRSSLICKNTCICALVRMTKTCW